ncbi:MAG: oligoendopeptidase [Firmicutes bacterium]|nr:oligoendopeptidase [Bacillota bacterium]
MSTGRNTQGRDGCEEGAVGLRRHLIALLLAAVFCVGLVMPPELQAVVAFLTAPSRGHYGKMVSIDHTSLHTREADSLERLPKRNEVKPEHTWNLESMYPNNEAWEQDFAKVTELTPRLAAFQGKLRESGQSLLDALKVRDEVYLLLDKVGAYAHMRRDEDATNGTYQALNDRATSLYSRVGAAGSYMTPEILEIPAEQLKQFMEQAEGLGLYRHELADLLREKEHVRSAEVEELLAQSGEMAGAARSIFGMLDNADMKFPMVKDENGQEVQLTKGRFIRFLESPNRSVREGAFKAVYDTYGGFRNTIAATYSSAVKKDVFYARARNYESSRAMALAASNIPESVYDNLVETVHRNLPSLHRYIQLRRKLLGLNELHMYDLYTPMVSEADKKVPYDEAVATIMKALQPLGEEYTKVAKEGITTARWVDIYENEGKRGGAYSGGAFTGNPFILMNYQDTLDSMFTLAHELGHSMHSYLTRHNQPFVYGNYTIFVAEVASTFNEALLTDYLLKNTDDKKLKMYLINHYLEQFRATLFRQTMFAEFEMKAHQMAEKNEPLTPDALEALYYELNKQYYGTEGMVVDDEIRLEWSRIPHFYGAYYVYQYATGLSAAVSLSRQVLGEGQPAVDRYLGFLKKGNAEYSIDLLKGAGVDMTSPEPVQQALDVFAKLVDQMEELAR